MDEYGLAMQLFEVARRAAAEPDGEAQAALLGLIAVTAGAGPGRRLCRRLLEAGLGELAGVSPATSKAAAELAAHLDMAAEHAEALAAGLTARPPG